MVDYWQRQHNGRPLFPDMLWSRPENRALAGKLLVVGGNAHGFAAPAEAYIAGLKAGAGTVRVLLPDSLAKTLGKSFEAGEFAPSTPSGSFAQKALAEWLDMAQWADGVLGAGDMGRNSETAIVLEKFLQKYPGQLTLAGDSADYLLAPPLAAAVLRRPQTLLVLSFGQLQKLATAARSPRAVTSDMDLVRLVEVLHNFSLQHQAYVMAVHQGRAFVAVEGQVSDTPAGTAVPAGVAASWHSQLAATASVWWLQNPAKPFQALTSSLVA